MNKESEWKDWHKVNNKPSFENIVSCYWLQVCYNNKCLWVFVTLDKVQKKIKPKHKFDNLINYFKSRIIRISKRYVKHTCHTRVSNKKQDNNIKYGFPLWSLTNDNPILTRFWIDLGVHFDSWLVHSISPSSSGCDGRRVKYFGWCSCSIQSLSSFSFNFFKVALLNSSLDHSSINWISIWFMFLRFLFWLFFVGRFFHKYKFKRQIYL